MPKSYRKRAAAELEEEPAAPEAGEDAAARARLEDTRRLQQERTRVRGVEVARLAGLAEAAPAAAPEAAATQEEDEGLKQAFFAEQRQQEGEEDPAMLRFIETELAKRRGTAAPPLPPPGDLTEASLYETPAELAPPPVVESTDTWLTGIAEVALPIEERLRAVDASERARREAQLRGGLVDGGGANDAAAVKKFFDAERRRGQRR